eukprot:6211339-Pleurochrysis_carterae.AAC.3
MHRCSCLCGSCLQGAVLLYAKEVINDGCANAGVGKTASGFLAGAARALAHEGSRTHARTRRARARTR